MHDNDPLERLLDQLPAPHAHRRIGRNEAQLAVFFRAMEMGHSMTAAASLAGVSTNSVKRWRKIDRAFRDQFETARETGRAALAQRRIEGGLAA